MTAGFVVGGVGGSGTRAIVELFTSLMPMSQLKDQNAARDSLGATLLFKRPSIFDEDSDLGFSECWNMLRSRLEGGGGLGRRDVRRLARLAMEKRIHHKRSWLFRRAVRFYLAESRDPTPEIPWLVKEPNLQIFTGSILQGNSDVRMAIVMRNGLDMAFSGNRQQASIWGDVDGEATPSNLLEHWCRSHERLLALKDAYPDRMMFILIERLHDYPEEMSIPLGRFLGVEDTKAVERGIRNTIKNPSSRYRHLGADLTALDVDLIEKFRQIDSRIT